MDQRRCLAQCLAQSKYATMLPGSTHKGKRRKPYKMMARWNVRERTTETSGMTVPCPGEATGLRPQPHPKTGPEAGPPGSCSSAPYLIPPCLSSLNALMGRPHKGWYQNTLNAKVPWWPHPKASLLLPLLRCSSTEKSSPSPCSDTNSIWPGVSLYLLTGPQFPGFF